MPSPLLALPVAAAVVSAVLSVYAWRRRREPGGVPFAALMATVFLWSGAYAVALVSFDLDARLFWRNVQWVAISVLPVTWLAFALDYTGRTSLLRRRYLLALSVVPAVTIVAAWTNHLHGLMWASNDLVPTAGLAVIERQFGLWYLCNLAYAYVLYLAGLGVLGALVVSGDDLYRGQTVSLVVGSAIAWLGNVAANLRLLPIPIDWTPVVFAVTGLVFGHAIFRYRLLDLVPASLRAGRSAVMAEMQDGVVVLDADGVVVDCNPVAAEAFDTTPAAAAGESVGAVTGHELAALRESRFVAPGNATLEVRVTRLADSYDRETGYVVVFRDVTELRRYQQRLQVVNRVLRHNLRNDITVVRGLLEVAAERSDDPEITDLVTRARSKADDLVETADDARDIRRVTEHEQSPVSVELDALVEEVVEAVADDFPDCAFVRDCADAPTAFASPDLDVALEHLVENAAEHNDAENPRVEVGCRAAGDEVELVVADNGPGVPDHELAVIEAGEETALEHGSGLGLWLAAWVVRSSGGSLAFDADDGTVATVTLPASDPEA